jgi:hypothetical protein
VVAGQLEGGVSSEARLLEAGLVRRVQMKMRDAHPSPRYPGLEKSCHRPLKGRHRSWGFFKGFPGAQARASQSRFGVVIGISVGPASMFRRIRTRCIHSRQRFSLLPLGGRGLGAAGGSSGGRRGNWPVVRLELIRGPPMPSFPKWGGGAFLGAGISAEKPFDLPSL